MENRIEKQKVQIIVATHKRYPMPSDSMYLPLHVGADIRPAEPGYVKDNTGDNISLKNGGFCELTGLYWAWKNLDAEYMGLVHYRRHFCKKKYGKSKMERILTYQELEPLLVKYSVFVPRKRKYYIESLYSHYAHTFYAQHLDCMRAIIEEKYPTYLNAYDRAINRRYGYMFNMFILRRDYLSRYCDWLFDILFELENRLDTSGMSAFHARLYGRVSEILFNVWLEQMMQENIIAGSDIKELDYMYMEKVNWWKKIKAFLSAKFFETKYEESF